VLDDEASVLLANGQARLTGIAVDATYAYWTNNTDGTVRRVAK